jgi:hypothetical protein
MDSSGVISTIELLLLRFIVLDTRSSNAVPLTLEQCSRLSRRKGWPESFYAIYNIYTEDQNAAWQVSLSRWKRTLS